MTEAVDFAAASAAKSEIGIAIAREVKIAAVVAEGTNYKLFDISSQW
jgi:hypothetical protein